VKRWVREAFRAVQAELPAVDLIVIARAGALGMGIDGARRALRVAGEKLAGGRA
jgi:ribonuclease P protein component